MDLKFLDSQDYANHVGKNANGLFHVLTHKALEKKSKKFYANILEVGAGNAQHLKYLKSSFEKYTMIDLEIPENVIKNDKTEYVKGDIHQLPFADCSYDKIILTCILHHLSDPVKALSELRRVAKDDGEITILLPSDPGLIFRFLRKIFADSELKRKKVKNIALLRAVDHRNHVASLISIIKFVFAKDKLKISGYPARIKLWNLNLFFIINVHLQKNAVL
jgi:phosphatidylethanolamine/phosphatidyl-N-methylethanolamine N-methyltransferase